MADARVGGPVATPVLVALVILAAVVAVVAFRIGGSPLGTALPADEACLARLAPASAAGADPDYGRLDAVHAEQTWVPLGIVCREEGASAVAFQSWPATATALAGILIAAGSSTALFRRLRRG